MQRKSRSDSCFCNASIYLQKFDRRTVVFNEGDQDARTWTVWFDDDFLTAYRLGNIFNLKRHVRNCLDQSWIRRIVFISCPLNAVWIPPVATHVHFQMPEMNFILQLLFGGYANVVVFHGGFLIQYLVIFKPDLISLAHSTLKTILPLSTSLVTGAIFDVINQTTVSKIKRVNSGHTTTTGRHRSIHAHIYAVTATRPNICYGC
jgi:hypothetical protein